MAAKVAIVTGSNKGIGYAIVRGLCKKFDGHVYITARDESRGLQAVKDLEGEGLKPLFHQLDIDDQTSIDRLADYIKTKYGGLDILVNNAGIAFKAASTAPFVEQAEVSMKTNYWGTLAVCNALFPLLRPQARVVNVSSTSAPMTFKKCSPGIQAKIKEVKTIEDVSKLVDKFVSDTKAGRHKEEGWHESGYGTSKIGVSLMSTAQQASMDTIQPEVVINYCCPGYVDTDMTSHKGNKTIDQGADTPLYLALLPVGTDIRGQFVSDRKVKNWLES